METINKGIIFNHEDVLSIDYYVDSDFTGLWHVANLEESISVNSLIRYDTTLALFPLAQASKLYQMMEPSKLVVNTQLYLI